MICFKDKTFCSAATNGICDNDKCWRFFTENDQEDLNKWNSTFSAGAGPIAYADFSYNCDYYRDKFLTNKEKKI